MAPSSHPLKHDTLKESQNISRSGQAFDGGRQRLPEALEMLKAQPRVKEGRSTKPYLGKKGLAVYDSMTQIQVVIPV